MRRSSMLRCAATAATATASSSASAASSSSSSAASAPSSATFPAFEYKIRIRYTPLFATKGFFDFLMTQNENVLTFASTYVHEPSGITVTLIPIAHYAHPKFFHQVDGICCQHDSVLMEGRVPITGAPYSTLVPPREYVQSIRPPDAEDSEGWEPLEAEKYWQPFSWGVKGSPRFTVVHAADKYDMEKLPWWAPMRFNIPLAGSYAREKHCLDMIPHLSSNGYKRFAIPWGMGHMPVFHDMLVDHGFQLMGTCSLIMWSKIDGDNSAQEFSRYDYRFQQSKLYGQWIGTAIVLVFLFYAVPIIIGFESQTEKQYASEKQYA